MNPMTPYRLTFCLIDDELVRVWGIADRERYEYIENILEMNKDRLVEGMGKPMSAVELAAGSLVLVKQQSSQGPQFKRGIIIYQDPATKNFRIRLLDVGSNSLVPVDDIRLASAVPHLKAIDDAACAHDYILADALAKPSAWSVEEFHIVNRALRIHSEVQVIGSVAGKMLISWSVLDSSTRIPFFVFLNHRGLAEYASLDAVKDAVLRKHAPHSQRPSGPPPRMANMLVRHPYRPPAMISPTMVSPPMRGPPGIGSYPRPQPPRIAPIIRAQQFKVDTLPVDSSHEVHVCCVIEGPQSFMIQVKKNVEERLMPLMAAINDVNFHPEPIDSMMTGLMCLGRFSLDGTLCRAVVSMVLPEEAANLLFVDFGSTEAVPFKDIYKLPPEFIEEPVMALPFTLAGLSNSPALQTFEARQIFEDLVNNSEYLLLRVVKPEIQLKQYCDLYITDRGAKVNIKQKVLDKVKLMKPAEYKKLSFKQNSSNDVIVSYVESATRFFVQLEVNQPLIDTLMASVEEYCVTSAMKDLLFVEDVNENMAVCCQYTDQKWYRGLIAEDPLDDGHVIVFYVDYGNQDVVHYSKLRVMNNEMISKLPMQAVECRLDIDADFALREEVIEAFAELVDLNSYKMKVINVLPANVLLVDLFDEQDRSVKDVLLAMFNVAEPTSPIADNAAKSTASQGSGNWRERKSSSNDGDFSAFRREDQQQRSRGKSDSDDRGRRNSDYKRQDSRGFDETDDAIRSPTKEHSSSERWPQDRADKRSPRDDWPAKSNGRDDDRYGGKPRDDGGNRRFERDGENRWNNRDGERKSYRRQDDGDSRGGVNRGDDDGDRKPYRKRDDSGSRSSRDGDYKKPYNRDDGRGGGGGFRKNDDDRNRGKSEWNGEKSTDDWSGGGKKNDSSWGGKKNDSDFGGRINSDWNSKKNDDWSNKKSDGFSNQKSDDWGSKKNDDWSNKKSDGFSNQKGDDWGGKKNDDWSNKKTDDWSNKKSDDWGSKKNGSDDWGGKKNDSDWKGKPSFDRDDRRPRRDNDYKPRDGGYNSRDGNRQRGGGFGAQSDSFKSTPSLSDGYPAGSQIAESDFQVGHQMAVEVSWFLNPVHFFLIPAGNADFRKLMESMQPDYPQRKNAELNSLSPGHFVAARAKDEVIYRAKVIQTRPGGATVSFVDYGNSESVSRNQIWTIGGDHCSQPVQALCCGLHNISSTGEGGQWSLPADGEKYFGKDKYTVTFVECREETSSKTWFVNLADENNQDIADLLVADGLAVKNNVLKSEELYDIEMLRDQILTVFPGHIDSSKKFFVHIEPPKTEMIQQNIATLAEKPESLVPLPTEEIHEGGFCLAMADDEVYYRAQILSVNEAKKITHVVYIDYGDENDVTFDKIKTIPEYLMIYNPQIIECCLHDAESFSDEKAFNEALKETDFMIKVMDVIDNKLSVFVFDINGARLPYPVEVEESVDVLCSLPMLKACERVFITHITADKVYLTRASDADYIADLCEQLMKHYDAEEPTKVPLECGMFYAVKSKIFESWYRAILPSADSQEVYYIDYGNTESIEDLLAVKPLDKSFFVSPTYCVAASTSIKFTSAELLPLIDVVAPVSFKAKFERRPDGWHVDVKCEKTGKTLCDFAKEVECSFESIESKTDADQKYVAFNEWQLNEEKNVSVAHVVSPNSFYLHLASDVEKIEAMQLSLQRTVSKLLPLVGPVDGLLAVQKSDGKWCRATVQDPQSVFAVDFGETLTTPVMKKLPLSFAENQSNYIVECSLNVNSIENSWGDAAVNRFRDLVGSGKEIVAKLEFLKSLKLIDLIVDGVSVGSTLVNENLAQWKCHEVTVSHANSLSDFYIQEPDLLDDLYGLGDKLLEADAWESVEPAVDDLVAAKYDEDQQWYRAVVVKIEDVKYVRFVDYGNESACSQFRVLPDSLKCIPHFSSKCSLHTIPENVDGLDEKFVDLVGSADGSFAAYFLNRVEPMLVMLYYNNTAIEDVLQEKPAEVVDLPTTAIPAESVVFDNVAVCHINSPSSFYVQSETAPLDEVATALVEVENAPVAEPAVGSIVAALFPDDGVWYRAKICDMTEGVNVLFIDYGNTCTVTELRQLPENVKNMPALAKHCAFTLPAGLDQWPDIAKQRFSELTCEGNTIFKLNLQEEGDPAYVDLQDVGVNVADELATLCKADMTATPLLSRATESVLLSHVESLNELWIQFQSLQLDEMVNEMANAETFDAIDAADEGLLVAAMFADDGAWYRAKVIRVADGVYDVLFIDYGNRSSTSSIKALPADLVSLPALAKCCQLKDFVEVAESHVDAVVAKLKEMVDLAQVFTVSELVETDGVNFVSLDYENDKNLTTEMLTFYNTLVTSDAPVSSQSETIKEAQENETAELVQDADATENAESVDVPSEGVADSEKVVETVPYISEQLTDNSCQEVVAVDEAAVTKETAEEGEQIAKPESEIAVTVPVENAEKAPVHLENGDTVPCLNAAKEESISCQKPEKVPEKIVEVDSVTSADGSCEVTETPGTTLPEASVAVSTYNDDVEEVDEPVLIPEKNLDTENSRLVVCLKDCLTVAAINTPLPKDDEETLDTSGSVSDLTPDFKTPLSKFAFNAEDSFVSEVASTDQDSNPDHFVSAVGPADSASPFSTPGDLVEEVEFVDLSMESCDGLPPSLDSSNASVVEFIIAGMTPREFIRIHGSNEVSDSAPNAGQDENESTTVCVPPLAKEEDFDSWQSSESTEVAGQDVAHVLPELNSAQFNPSCVSEELQFADADETSTDELADLLSGMSLSDKQKMESRDEVPPKVDPTMEDVVNTDEGTPEQSKCDPEFEDIGEEVAEDHAVDQKAELSSSDLMEFHGSCNEDSEKAVIETSPTEQLEAAKLSDSDESTVSAQSDGTSNSTESSTVGDISEEVVQDHAVDQKAELSSSDLMESYGSCNEESEKAVVELSQTEQLEAAKSSDSDESTVSAQSDGTSNSTESSTVGNSSFEMSSNEVVEKPSDVAQSNAEASESFEVHEDDGVSLETESKVESDSAITDPAFVMPSDPPSSEKASADDELSPKDDKKTLESGENAFFDAVIATEVAQEFFDQLVASADDEFSPKDDQKTPESGEHTVLDAVIATEVTLEFFDQLVASADDELLPKGDKKTPGSENTFLDTVPKESDSLIAAEVAQGFFNQLVASADDEFNSTSNPFLNAEDTLGLMSSSSSDSESGDTYIDSTSESCGHGAQDDTLDRTSDKGDAAADIAQSPPVHEDDENVAQSLTSIQGDSLVHVDLASSSTTARCNTQASEDVAQPSIIVEVDSGAQDLPTVNEKEDAQSPPVLKDEASALKDVAPIALPVDEESTSSLAIVEDEDSQSPASGADIPTACKDDEQSPPAVGDSFVPGENAHSPSTLEDVDLSVESFKYVPSKRMPIRPEPSQPATSSIRDESISPDSNGAAEIAPAPSADTESEQSTKPSEDCDDESLPSSGAAEVAHALANVCQRDTSHEGTPQQSHRQRPPRSALDGATSKQSPSTTDLPESSTLEQDDNVSVYFDSCAEPRSVDLSDDEQQPTSFTSSTSDETSIASAGDADEAELDWVIVSYVNTPGNFFVQRVVDEEALRNVEKQLDEFENTETAPSEVRLDIGGAVEPTLYGAKIDDRLYRVSVLNVNCAGESGAEYEVRCIDYGRICQTRKLFALPDSLQSVDPLAIPCSLRLPCYLREWPVDVCHEFERRVMTAQPRFQMKCRQLLDGVAIVDLIKGRRSISQRMKTLCEEFNQTSEFDAKQGKPTADE